MLKLPSFIKLSSVLSQAQLRYLQYALKRLLVPADRAIMFPQGVDESVKNDMAKFYAELLDLVNKEVK